MKKLVSILLVAVMMLAMTTTVFASGELTTADVTINNLSDHTFAAYQVFVGDYDVTEKQFTNIVWGDGVTSATLIETLKADNTVVVEGAVNNNVSEVTVASAFASATTAEDVAQVLSKYSTNDALVEAFVEAAYASKTTTSTTISAGTVSLTTGYYLIVDTTTSVSNSTTVKAYNNALLQVVGSTITIDKKTDAPTVEKKVYEEDYKETGTGYLTGYNNVADYDIGDAIDYELIGTIPDTSEYSYYRYVFTDTLSKGLTANTSSIKVYLADDKSSRNNWVEVAASVTTNESVVTNWTPATSTVSGGDYDGGTTLTVSFSDILSLVNASGSVISLDGYKYIIVEYNATLNSNAVIGLDGNPNEVYLTYSSNPNSTGAEDTDDKTEDTPKDKVIVFTYELDVTKVDSTDNSKVLENAEFVLYKEVNRTKYYWTGSTNSEPWTTVKDNAETLKSNSSGIFSVKGLDDGTYYLEETKAPTGYSLLSNPITLVVTATTVNRQTWDGQKASDVLTAITISVDGESPVSGNVNDGTVSATVENTPGSGLPTTGGMGTTILYIIGAILVIGAGVLLVTRRRLSR